jgi:hypothetical protein
VQQRLRQRTLVAWFDQTQKTKVSTPLFCPSSSCELRDVVTGLSRPRVFVFVQALLAGHAPRRRELRLRRGLRALRDNVAKARVRSLCPPSVIGGLVGCQF